MELRVINSNIKKVAKTGAAFNALVQATILGIIAHAQQHGDCTPALRLVQAMPKSTKRSAVIEHFAEFSPIGMNLSTGKVGFHKEGSKAYRPFNLEGAAALNWYDRASVQKEELPATLDTIDKRIFALAGWLGKKIEEGLVPANDVDAVNRRIAVLKDIGRVAYAHRRKTEGKAAPRKKAA